MPKAASQSETGDVITMNTSSDTPTPFTIINMTPPTTVYNSGSDNEANVGHEPLHGTEPSTTIHEYNITPPATVYDSESGNETDLEDETHEEDTPRYTLALMLGEVQGTIHYQRGEINWTNLTNNNHVPVSDHLQDSFRDLGLTIENAQNAVLELEANLGIDPANGAEAILHLLRWSLNDRFKHRAEN